MIALKSSGRWFPKVAVSLKVLFLSVAVVMLLADLASILGIATQTLNLYDDSRRITGVLCHRLPSRSPWFGGFPTALCYRCVGIYSGILVATPVLVGARGRWRFAQSRWLALVLILPTLIEISAEYVFQSSLWPVARQLFGGLVGVGIFAFLGVPRPGFRSG